MNRRQRRQAARTGQLVRSPTDQVTIRLAGAAHEAGHAVAAHLAGGTVTRVWVGGHNGASHGACVYTLPDAAADPSQVRLRAKRRIFIALAGAGAEALIVGCSNLGLRSKDVCKAREVAEAAGIRYDETEAIRKTCEALKPYAPSIRAVADLLLERGELTEADIRRCLDYRQTVITTLRGATP
jgi:hypothetical protein